MTVGEMLSELLEKMDKMAERLDENQNKLDYIQKRIDVLDYKTTLDVIGPSPYIPNTPDTPQLVPEIKCSKCGMNFEGSMGYVCNDLNCPMGCGPTIC